MFAKCKCFYRVTRRVSYNIEKSIKTKATLVSMSATIQSCSLNYSNSDTIRALVSIVNAALLDTINPHRYVWFLH